MTRQIPTYAPSDDNEGPNPDRFAHELRAGKAALNGIGPIVGVYGSARTPFEHPDYELTRSITRELSQAGYVVVTGGGPGTMEAANRGAQEGGSLSVGLPIVLPGEQSTNKYVDIAISFYYFGSRKFSYIRNAIGFVVFPGGFGTLDELFETATLMETGKIPQLPIVLVGRAYWAPLIDWLRNTVVADGKLPASKLKFLTVVDTPEEVLKAMRRGALHPALKVAA